MLLNLRGADQLCMDLATAGENRRGRRPHLRDPGKKLTGHLGDTHECRVGTINWVGLWSDRPYHVLECDFNYMIGPRPFRELLSAGNPGAGGCRRGAASSPPGWSRRRRHIQALLDTPEITAIQYVTGAGNSALTHLDMLKAIQKAGRPLQVTVPYQEAVELSRALDPSGLCLLVEGDPGPEGLNALYAEVCRYYTG